MPPPIELFSFWVVKLASFFAIRTCGAKVYIAMLYVRNFYIGILLPTQHLFSLPIPQVCRNIEAFFLRFYVIKCYLTTFCFFCAISVQNGDRRDYFIK